MTTRRSVTALLVGLMLSLLAPTSVSALPPVAFDDSKTVGEDAAPTTIDVLGNDLQVGLDPLSIDSATNPAHGTVVIAGDDLTVTYEPDLDYHGADTFDYVVTDGVDSDVGSVDVTVSSINDDPVADNDSFTINEDVTTDLDVLAGDTDVDGDTLVIAGNPPDGAHGTTSVFGGEVRYNPDTNYDGPDSFTYTVSDGEGGTDSATVSVTVSAANDGPTAVNDSKTVVEDITTTLDIVGNDTDPDDDSLTVSAIGTQPTKGTVTITNGGADVSYDPNPNATGSDDFTYTVTDGASSDSGTVNITISPVDDPPNAMDDTATVMEDTPRFIDVLANDTDPDSAEKVTAVTQGSKGAVTITNEGDDVSYVPDPNETGTDTFTYTITASGDTDTATVNVTITGENDPPDAIADSATFDEDETTDIDVRDNDTDIDGDTLTITDTTDGAHGTTSVFGGQVRYTPTADEHGSDTFSYTISDGNGGSDSVAVTVTIASINDAPVADDDDGGVAEDAGPTPVLVLAGDVDVDGDVITIVGKTNGTKGIVAITDSGTGLTYDPFTNQVGSDTFTYTISDGLVTDTATVTMTIGDLNNDSPNAVNDPSMSVPQGAGATTLEVLGNDVDVDGDDLIITSKTSAAHGTVAITGFGTGLTYNPAGLYKGSDTFKYTVSDGHGGTDTATVVVTVVRDTVDPVVVAPAQRLLGQTVGSSTTKIRLSWSATDAGVGVAGYRFQVSTNGGGYTTITLAKSTSTTVDRTLATGKTYRFRVSATDKEGNVSTFRYGPTFLVSRYSQEHSKVAYVGSWKRTVTSKALNGSTRNASTSTRSATFTFTGYDVGWVTTRATTSGKAEIYLDGVLVKTIDLDTSSTAYRKLVYQRHFSTLEAHTLRIRPLGDGRVDIDGFAVLR